MYGLYIFALGTSQIMFLGNSTDYSLQSRFIVSLFCSAAIIVLDQYFIDLFATSGWSSVSTKPNCFLYVFVSKEKFLLLRDKASTCEAIGFHCNVIEAFIFSFHKLSNCQTPIFSLALGWAGARDKPETKPRYTLHEPKHYFSPVTVCNGFFLCSDLSKRNKLHSAGTYDISEVADLACKEGVLLQDQLDSVPCSS